MDAQGFRALADRCRELARVAVRDDIREQLRQWMYDFEAEAEAAEKAERSLGWQMLPSMRRESGPP